MQMKDRAPRAPTGLMALTLSGLALASPAAAELTELHVMNAGGLYADALDKCVNDAFFDSTGIKVIQEVPGGYAKLASQAQAGVVANVVSDAATGELYREIAEGLIEPINYDALAPEPMFDEARHEYGFGASYYSTIMAWRKDVKAPSNFVEFFDTENFPGTRGLPDYPDFVLPFAALAAGMTTEEVSQGLDLDLAFETLNRVKDDVIWWQAGAQSAQLLKDNEAQYVISWSGRVIGHDDIAWSFQDGMLDVSWWVVAKGASDEEKEVLWKWMHEQSKPSVQLCITEETSYPGPALGLAEMLPAEMLPTIPTSEQNKAVQWLLNGQWWFDNAAEIETRWNEFKLQ